MNTIADAKRNYRNCRRRWKNGTATDTQLMASAGYVIDAYVASDIDCISELCRPYQRAYSYISAELWNISLQQLRGCDE